MCKQFNSEKTPLVSDRLGITAHRWSTNFKKICFLPGGHNIVSCKLLQLSCTGKHRNSAALPSGNKMNSCDMRFMQLSLTSFFLLARQWGNSCVWRKKEDTVFTSSVLSHPKQAVNNKELLGGGSVSSWNCALTAERRCLWGMYILIALDYNPSSSFSRYSC